MKIKTVIAVSVAAALIAIPASADRVVYRATAGEGSKPGHDVLISIDKIEVVALGVGGDFPIHEVGRLWQISKSKQHIVLGGIFGSHWEKVDQWYLEPFMLIKAWRGDTTVTATPFTYLPINGGDTYAGADELSIIHKVFPGVEVGVEGSFFKVNPSPFELKWGPTVRLKKGGTSVSVRYLRFGEGADTLRLSLNRNFP